MRRILSWFCFFASFWLVFSLGYAAYGAELELDVRKLFINYNDNELSVNQWSAVELRLNYGSVFMFAEPYSSTQVRWGGQDAGDLITHGIGVGLQHDFRFDRFTLTPWGKVGYYRVNMDLEDGPWTWDRQGSYWESLIRKQWELVGSERHWDQMSFELDNDIVGGAVGVDLSYNIWRRLFLGVGIAYSYMQTSYEITGRNISECIDEYWSANGNLDLSSVQGFIGLSWEF